MPSNTGTCDRKRAVLYARVSTDEHARSGYSLAQQMEEALRAYVAREGLAPDRRALLREFGE